MTTAAPRQRRRRAWENNDRTPQMRLEMTYREGVFIWLGGYETKEVPKRAGFRWPFNEPDKRKRYWHTRDLDVASQLKQYADEAALKALGEQDEEAEAALAESRATDADIDVPAPAGLEYLPYQRAGIAYALKRFMQGLGVLIGDEMGLGKTVQALGLINADPAIEYVLIVCPASLKINWLRETTRWLVRPAFPMIAGDYFPIGTKIVIVNYEQLEKHQRSIQSREWDLLIGDEIHYCKNPQARRTKAMMAINAKRRVFLTGTPIVNRPMELWPLLQKLAPSVFNDEPAFRRSYAEANPKNVHGRRALAKLQTKLRSTVMVRRLKKDVLTELPPKMRQVVVVPQGKAAAVVREEQELLSRYFGQLLELRVAVEMAKASEWDEAYEVARKKLNAAVRAFNAEIAKLRHEMAVAKVPAVIEHVNEALQSSEKVVLFGHHRDAIDAYAEHFGSMAVKLTGDMDTQARQVSVDAFQKGDARVFIGSIRAAGVGLTLTAASHVVFSELDWTPAQMSQAEDRCHRIGQTDSVLVQHVVVDGSLDLMMAETLVAKQRVIDAALDGSDKEELAANEIVPLPDDHATANVTRKRVLADAAKLGIEHLRAVEAALASITVQGNDVDRAMYAQLVGRRLNEREAVLALRIAKKYETKENPE